MSLDIYLISEETDIPCECSHCEHKHFRKGYDTFYEDNITHNLGSMATEAGLYEALWRPHRLKDGYNIPNGAHDAEYEFEKENPSLAKDIIAKLEQGLDLLTKDPERFKKFNPENGWGKYENLVKFTKDYLTACKEYPEAIISISR